MLGSMEQDPQNPKFVLEDVIAQEEKFVFDSFSQNDARRLGSIMFDIIDEYNMAFAFEIYLNGVVVLKYLPEGTGKCHDQWMQKKVNTVMTMGWSTMRLWALGDRIGNKRTASWLPSEDIVMCGGGFPIRVKGAGVIGAIACSGPGDQNDHEFCIEALKRYFSEE